MGYDLFESVKSVSKTGQPNELAFHPRTPGDRRPYLGWLGLVRWFFLRTRGLVSLKRSFLIAWGAIGEDGFFQGDAFVVIRVEAGGALKVRL